MRALPWAADVGPALRSLRRAPWLAAVVVTSLAAGIGVNAVIFSWIEATVLHPLPEVADAAAIQIVEPVTAEGGHPGVSWPEFLDLRAGLTSVHDLFASRMLPLYVAAWDGAGVDRVFGLLVSPNYFDALGVRPVMGRFPDAHDGPDGLVAVASYGFWQSHLGATPDAIGRAVRVNGAPLTLVGVTPPRFQGTELGLSFDLWVPAALGPRLANGSQELESRTSRGYKAMGWLRPNLTGTRAQHELNAVMARLARTYPESNEGVTAALLPFLSALRGPPRVLPAVLMVLQLFMLLVLAAVCGNVATLLLARASARQKDFATRLALGATPWQVARLALTESLILAIAGASGGIVLAFWGTRGLLVLPLTGFPIRFQASLDGTGLAAALGVGIASGLVCGATSVWQLARRSTLACLHGGSVAARTPSSAKLQAGLLGIQAALAVVVLVVAGSSLRSFIATRTTDPGFDRHGVLLVAYDLAGRDSASDAFRIRRDLARAMLADLRRLPGVEAAAIGASVPLDIHGMPSRRVTVAGRARARSSDGSDETLVNTVTSGYFVTMRIPMVAGTDIDDVDRDGDQSEAIVNVEFVRRYLAGVAPAEAIGRRLRIGNRDRTIVGVSANSLYDAFGDPPMPMVYLSFADAPLGAAELHVRVRLGADMSATAREVRAELHTLDPGLALVNVRTLDQHVDSNLIFRRVPAQMFLVLGPLLLGLASIGIYAVVEYVVVRRTAEVGLRLALGATPGQVVGALVAEHMAVIASGVLPGWLIALILTILGGFFDVPVLVAAPVILLASAAAACWLPARRATRADPAEALRCE